MERDARVRLEVKWPGAGGGVPDEQGGGELRGGVLTPLAGTGPLLLTL